MADRTPDLRDFLEQRRREETLSLAVKRMRPQHICLHCGNPFEPGQGVVTDDGSLCDVCNGD
jgi:hypothetical protein